MESPNKKRRYPPMRKEAFREHFWYRYIDEYLKCGKVELPTALQAVVVSVLDRMGYDCTLQKETADTAVLVGNHERPAYYPDNQA